MFSFKIESQKVNATAVEEYWILNRPTLFLISKIQFEVVRSHFPSFYANILIELRLK